MGASAAIRRRTWPRSSRGVASKATVRAVSSGNDSPASERSAGESVSCVVTVLRSASASGVNVSEARPLQRSDPATGGDICTSPASAARPTSSAPTMGRLKRSTRACPRSTRTCSPAGSSSAKDSGPSAASSGASGVAGGSVSESTRVPAPWSIAAVGRGARGAGRRSTTRATTPPQAASTPTVHREGRRRGGGLPSACTVGSVRYGWSSVGGGVIAGGVCNLPTTPCRAKNTAPQRCSFRSRVAPSTRPRGQPSTAMAAEFSPR
jgi:hypothetical protein